MPFTIISIRPHCKASGPDRNRNLHSQMRGLTNLFPTECPSRNVLGYKNNENAEIKPLTHIIVNVKKTIKFVALIFHPVMIL